MSSIREVFGAFLRLGVSSFGGPTAHIGYFQREFVERRKWIDAQGFADLVALCQFLPGPASSQVGISLGMLRAGIWGGIAAWIGFTMPSALVMIGFALGLGWLGGAENAPWLQGLKVVAVAVVAQAVWSMASKLCPDRPRALIAICTAIIMLLLPGALSQVGAIVIAGVLGWRLLPGAVIGGQALQVRIPRWLSNTSWVLLGVILFVLPLLRQALPSYPLALFDSFFRTGALVFGGGHVVLPLLEAETVAPGWVSAAEFTAGYGAAQAMPGPLFTFSAYLGAVAAPQPNGFLGGMLALVAVFAPSFLFLYASLPIWGRLRQISGAQAALAGVNAAVVGLLLAALYDPVWVIAIRGPQDVALALAAYAALEFGKIPPWLVVVGGGIVAGIVM